MGHEPVSEYCKSVDEFERHSQPSPEDLFKIILQLARFLKEFGDFETSKTPEFRHPGIKNKLVIDTHGVAAEGHNFSKITSGGPPKSRTAGPEKNSNSNHSYATHGEDYIISKHTKSNTHDLKGETNDEYDMFSEDSEVEISSHSEDPSDAEDKERKIKYPGEINYLEDIGLLKEIRRLSIFQRAKNKINKAILQEHESFNVDIPSQADEFRKVHMDMIYEKINKRKEYIQNLGVDNLPYSFKRKEDEFGHHSHGKSKPPLKLTAPGDIALNSNSNKLRKGGNIKQGAAYYDTLDLGIEPEKETSYYHYKRWIWIIFPWICMSTDPKCSFSEVIAKCYSSATKYMSVKEEREFTTAALKIAFSAPGVSFNVTAGLSRAVSGGQTKRKNKISVNTSALFQGERRISGNKSNQWLDVNNPDSESVVLQGRQNYGRHNTISGDGHEMLMENDSRARSGRVDTFMAVNANIEMDEPKGLAEAKSLGAFGGVMTPNIYNKGMLRPGDLDSERSSNNIMRSIENSACKGKVSQKREFLPKLNTCRASPCMNMIKMKNNRFETARQRNNNYRSQGHTLAHHEAYDLPQKSIQSAKNKTNFF